jgi:hypothetical protein
MLSVCSFLALVLLAAPAAISAQEEEAAQPERQAVPRESRPQGDNPRTGTAVPRASRPAPPPASAPPPRAATPNRTAEPRRTPPPPRAVVPRTVIVPPVYNNYYYYPRRYYPYGYGAFGLGYFYYDPYAWYPGYSAFPGYSGYPSPGFGNPYSVFDVGEVRLQVTPRHAQVYVDGYYAGTVDDYDGVLQSLKMQSGPYHIEITAPGYQTLEFDIRLNPGQKVTYRGDLRRLP